MREARAKYQVGDRVAFWLSDYDYYPGLSWVFGRIMEFHLDGKIARIQGDSPNNFTFNFCFGALVVSEEEGRIYDSILRLGGFLCSHCGRPQCIPSIPSGSTSGRELS